MSAHKIRAGVIDDLPRLTNIYNYYVEHTPTSFDVEPHTPEDRESSWFSHYKDEGLHRLLVIERDGEVAGYATSSQFRTRAAYNLSVETSVYLDHSQQGQGLGTALYAALFEELAKTPAHRAYGGVTLPNAASIALHKKFGFREVGIFNEVGFKFGKYYDVCWLEKDLRDSRGPLND